jgi:hypothetical protein
VKMQVTLEKRDIVQAVKNFIGTTGYSLLAINGIDSQVPDDMKIVAEVTKTTAYYSSEKS